MSRVHKPVEPTLDVGCTDIWVAECSCGWASTAGQPSLSKARKTAQSHADSMNDRLIEEAVMADVPPIQVIWAVARLNEDHPSVATTAWEHGTTAITIFTGDGGTTAIRYTMTADLTEIIRSERVSHR